MGRGGRRWTLRIDTQLEGDEDEEEVDGEGEEEEDGDADDEFEAMVGDCSFACTSI